jgi:hypothetical protein
MNEYKGWTAYTFASYLKCPNLNLFKNSDRHRLSILTRTLGGKTQAYREDNNTMELREVGWRTGTGGGAVVNAAMNLQVLYNAGNLTSWGPDSFSKRTLAFNESNIKQLVQFHQFTRCFLTIRYLFYLTNIVCLCTPLFQRLCKQATYRLGF